MTSVIVVGSGASGVNAAAALVEAGVRVTLIDFGNEDRTYAPLIPEGTFEEIRRTDPNQHRYFLGDEFEGITLGAVRVGGHADSAACLSCLRPFSRSGPIIFSIRLGSEPANT